MACGSADDARGVYESRLHDDGPEYVMSRGYELRSFCYSGPVIAQRARTLQLWPGVPGRWWRWVYDGRATAGAEKRRTKDLRLRSRAGQSIKKGRRSFIILYENTTYILYYILRVCVSAYEIRVYIGRMKEGWMYML